MNKTFNINLGGYPFAIDEDAYEYVQVYLETIRKHFSASDGCEEIIYDIEVRMAELFQEHLKARSRKLGDDDGNLRQRFEDFFAAVVAINSVFLENRNEEGARRLDQLRDQEGRIATLVGEQLVQTEAARGRLSRIAHWLQVATLLAVVATAG